MNQYFVGNFDGTSFTADDGVARLMDFGKDFYAVQTYNNTPSGDAIAVGWLSNWQYTQVCANLSLARGILPCRESCRYGKTRPKLELC